MRLETHNNIQAVEGAGFASFAAERLSLTSNLLYMTLTKNRLTEPVLSSSI